MVSREQLQELIELLDMEFWMEREGIHFQNNRGSRGPQLNVKECPCCGNSNWKTYIGAETGLGNCFVCDQHFNKWSFIKNYFSGNIADTIESIESSAREQGWRPPKKSMAVNLRTELKLPDSVAIPIQGRNLKYLENRHVDVDLAKYFALRFSMNGKFNYTDDSGQRKFQSYAKRIIIPIFDLAGDLVSFQGRDITGTAERKYLFPPGFASTGSVIYNGHNAHGAEHVVVGEGVFDVVAIKAALDQNMNTRDIIAVGTFGKHLSHGDDNSQLARLMDLKAEGLKTITFMWDGERQALHDAVDAALLVRSHGFNARVALLPKDRDPNEVTPDVVQRAFWSAKDINQVTATQLKLSKIYG